MVLVWIRTGRAGRRHIFYSSVAQSVEHLTVNQAVVGSSPIRGAKTPQNQKVYGVFFYYSGYKNKVFVIRGGVATKGA